MGLEGRETGIRQSVYLPIQRARDYQGVLFAQSSERGIELEVSFRKHDMPDAVLTLSRVSVPADGRWTKLPFYLSIAEGAVTPLEAVDFVVSLAGGHRVSLDEIRLNPSDAVEGLLDPDVSKAAASLRTPLLRWGGNFTSGYHRENGIGPIDRRRTMLNQASGYPEYNEFGTDELMTFCRLIGARPQTCLNLGSGTPEEARAPVEYCQGSPETPQGKRRAANGHPEPYPVAAWELGNELWGKSQIGWQTPEGYAERYKTFYQAIRDLVSPGTMIFANGADLDAYEEWNGALISKDSSELSFLTTHFVVGMAALKDPKQKPDRDTLWAGDLAIPVGVARALKALQNQVNAHPGTRERVKLAYTEWLFAAPEKAELPRYDNLGGALIATGWLNMLFQHADFVPVSDMPGLLEFGGIFKRRGRVYLTPQPMAFSLYSNYAGDTLVSTRVTTEEYDVRPGAAPLAGHVQRALSRRRRDHGQRAERPGVVCRQPRLESRAAGGDQAEELPLCGPSHCAHAQGRFNSGRKLRRASGGGPACHLDPEGSRRHPPLHVPGTLTHSHHVRAEVSRTWPRANGRLLATPRRQ
jgi:alpha-N-arabinofuranosidase